MVVLVKISASYQKDGKYESPPPILRHPPLSDLSPCPLPHPPFHNFFIHCTPFFQIFEKPIPLYKREG